MSIWLAPPDRLELKTGEVHLWRVDLDRHLSSLPVLEQTLTLDERRKADDFRSEADRNHYVLARAALRKILARYLGTPPRDLVFRYGPRGKPALASGALRFNVSHSDDLALYAISFACDIGVDIEHIRPGIEEDVSGWFLSLRAIRFLEALPQPTRRQIFFRGWTRMEAYSKARGEGITVGLENFEAFLGRRSALFLRARDQDCGARWWLHDFIPRTGYVGALALPGRRRTLRRWKWPADRPGAQLDESEVGLKTRFQSRVGWAIERLEGRQATV